MLRVHQNHAIARNTTHGIPALGTRSDGMWPTVHHAFLPLEHQLIPDQRHLGALYRMTGEGVADATQYQAARVLRADARTERSTDAADGRRHHRDRHRIATHVDTPARQRRAKRIEAGVRDREGISALRYTGDGECTPV